MALSPNSVTAVARFRISENGTLVPLDGTGSIPGTNLDLQNRRAGAGTVTIVTDPVPGGSTQPFTGTLLSLNDFLNLAKAISIPQPPANQPFSSLSAAYVVSVYQLMNQAAGSVVPQAYTEIVQPVPNKGANF